MAIIKHRPQIRLLTPPLSLVGGRSRLTTVLVGRRAFEVAEVRIDLVGRMRRWADPARTMRVQDSEVVRLRAVLCGERAFDKGTTKLASTFDLPPTLPPSFTGKLVHVEYTAEIHVSIPWWMDRSAKFIVPVTGQAMRADDTPPKVRATALHGVTGTQPHLEYSVDTRDIVAGDIVAGAVALYNVAHNRYRALEVALVSQEWSKSDVGGVARSDGPRYTITLPIDEAAEGESFPFRMRLPKDVTPSYQTSWWGVSWALEITAKVAFASDVVAREAVRVLSPGSGTGRPRRAVPPLGSARLQAMWNDVAARLGGQFADGRIVVQRDGTTITVSRRHQRGASLVATLSFPSLGIGLDGGAKRGFRRLWDAGVPLGSERTDKAHYLTARDPGQAKTIADAIGPLLDDVRLEDIRDDGLQIKVRDPGHGPAALGRFADRALRLAAQVRRARASLPAPAVMEPGLEAWRGLANSLGGTLDVGPMSILGRFEGVETTVATEWSPSGAPQRTRIELVAPQTLAETHALHWAEGELLEGRLEALPAAARKRLETLAAPVVEVIATARGVELDLTAPALDDALLRSGLDTALALLRELSPRTGPYR